jgi:hypothetical protein
MTVDVFELSASDPGEVQADAGAGIEPTRLQKGTECLVFWLWYGLSVTHIRLE